MSRRKAHTPELTPEAGDPQSGQPTQKQAYFFPNLDPSLPAVSVEAASREEAERQYHEQLKETR